MELIIINGASQKYCAALANKLRVAGYKHLDPSMYFILDDGSTLPVAAKTQILAKAWCKRQAMNFVLKGKPVVISATNFNESDLRGFRVVNCRVEMLNTDGEDNTYTLQRLNALVEARKQMSLWSQLTNRFTMMMRA